MAAIRVVLVEPREGGNVGAVARVMKNFGLHDLWIVGKIPQLQPVASWWASGADDLLANIRTAPTLEEALSDVHFSVATTSSRGRSIEVALSPREVSEIAAEQPEGTTVAIVFGREDRGLTSEEAAFCHRTAIVPTNALFPTMNLAQTVTVFAYEISLSTEPRTPAAPRQLAEHQLLERLHDRAAALLLEVGFLHETNPERIYVDVREIVARAALDRREAEILLGMIRQVEWKLRSSERENR